MIPKVDEEYLDLFIPVSYSNAHLFFPIINNLVTVSGP